MKAIGLDITGIANTDLAYAAGILDGEGCILIVPNRYGGKHPSSHNLQVRVSMTDAAVVPWLHVTFGGQFKIYKHKYCPLPQLAWTLYSRAAANFLAGVMPWLKCKRPQAELALTFQATIGAIGRRVSPETRIRREEMYQRMRQLKKVG